MFVTYPDVLLTIPRDCVPCVGLMNKKLAARRNFGGFQSDGQNGIDHLARLQP